MKAIILLISTILVSTLIDAQRYHRLDKPCDGEVINDSNILIFNDLDTITIVPVGGTQLLTDGAGTQTSITVNSVRIQDEIEGVLINCYNFSDSTRTIHIISVHDPKRIFLTYKIW